MRTEDNMDAKIAENELLLILAKIEMQRPKYGPVLEQFRSKLRKTEVSASNLRRAVEQIKNHEMAKDLDL